MTVAPLPGTASVTDATLPTATPAATEPGAFAAALAREMGATSTTGAVATPAAQAPAVASTPVTFGQMLALSTAAPGDGATALPAGASPLAQAAARLAASAPASAVGGAAPAASADGYVLPVEGRFSSPFGMRTHPVTGGRKMHQGIDIAAPTGTPIRAAAGGTVSFAGDRGGYGNVVIVDHPDGSQTRYAHQHELHVRAGDTVAAGQVVGTVGSTGMSTGPHLHFELRRGGEPVDPAPLLGLRR